MTYSKSYGFGASDQFSRLFDPLGGSGGGGGGGGGELWTPAAITTNGWYDSHDESTLFKEGASDRLLRWEDKSGRDNHMVNDGTNDSSMADTNGLIGGKPALNFYGTGHFYPDITSGSGAPSGQAASHAVVYRHHDNDTATRRVLNGIGGTWIIGPYNGVHQAYVGNWAVGHGLADIPEAIFILSKSASDLSTTHMNGSTFSSYQGNQFPTAYTIGWTSGVIQCDVGEVVSWFDDDEGIRQKMEGYLAWKWGLESTLPGGHPYKDAAPTL